MGCTSQTTLITACHSVAPGSGKPFLVYQLTGGPLEHDCRRREKSSISDTQRSLFSFVVNTFSPSKLKVRTRDFCRDAGRSSLSLGWVEPRQESTTAEKASGGASIDVETPASFVSSRSSLIVKAACSTPRRPRIQNKQISLSPEDRDLPHRRRAQRLRPLADREVHRPLSPPGQQKREIKRH